MKKTYLSMFYAKKTRINSRKIVIEGEVWRWRPVNNFSKKNKTKNPCSLQGCAWAFCNDKELYFNFDQWLPDDFPMTTWWLPDDKLMTAL